MTAKDVTTPAADQPTPDRPADVTRAERLLGTRRSTIARAIQEITFIVVGVLIALAANSWWQNRHDRERERLNLQLLYEATAENLRRVAAAVHFDSISMERGEKALLAVRTLRAIPLPDSIADWVYRAAWSSNFHPLTGAYSSVANNAELILIRNDSLRAAIVTIAGEITGVEQEIRTFDVVAMTNAERLFHFFDVVGSEARADSSWFVVRSELVVPSGSPNWFALQSSPAFERALFMVWTNAGNRLELLRRLRVSLQALLARLSAEIAR